MNAWFVAVLVITIGFWLWESIVDWLDSRPVEKLPDEVVDVFDKEEYAKSREYGSTKSRFGLLYSRILARSKGAAKVKLPAPQKSICKKPTWATNGSKRLTTCQMAARKLVPVK